MKNAEPVSVKEKAMTRGQAEHLVDSLNSFWRSRGYDPKAEIVATPGGVLGVTYGVKSALVNGLPPGFSSAERTVVDDALYQLQQVKS